MPNGQLIAAKIALVGIIAGLIVLVRPGGRLLRYACLAVMGGSLLGLLTVAGRMWSVPAVAPVAADNGADVVLAPEPEVVSSAAPPPPAHAAAVTEGGVGVLLGDWTCVLPTKATRRLRFQEDGVLLDTVNNGKERKLSYWLADPEHVVIRTQGREVTYDLSGVGPERRLKYRRRRRDVVCTPESGG